MPFSLKNLDSEKGPQEGSSNRWIALLCLVLYRYKPGHTQAQESHPKVFLGSLAHQHAAQRLLKEVQLHMPLAKAVRDTCSHLVPFLGGARDWPIHPPVAKLVGQRTIPIQNFPLSKTSVPRVKETRLCTSPFVSCNLSGYFGGILQCQTPTREAKANSELRGLAEKLHARLSASLNAIGCPRDPNVTCLSRKFQGKLASGGRTSTVDIC